MPFIALALIVAAALGGGTSVAAQQAMPGDALWGFKTSVNENIQATFAAGDKAKADLDIKLAETRLDEAAKLAASGKLDADTQAQIQGNFDAHVTAVTKHVEALQAKGEYAAAADVAARFQATVARHASALAEARTNANTHAQAALGKVIDRVRATLDAAGTLSANASTEAAAHPDSDTKEAGDDNASSTDERGAGVRVQTGTSVEGGEGGIKVDSETGAQVGI